MSVNCAEGAGGPEGRAGLYVHYPFCARICPYCDFAVFTGRRERRAALAGALASEAALWSGEPWAFDTVYLGGGTPSLMALEELAGLLAGLLESLGVEAGAPVFLEANPEDVTAEKAGAWRALGVGTLSLGVQALDDGALRFLGRRHSAAQGRRAVEVALEAGFDTVSMDLIYGLPGQESAAWRRCLEEAASLGTQHLSCYQLTVHDETPFGRWRREGRLVEAGEDRQEELFALTHQTLSEHGFEAYEVSNFARAPQHRSRHNIKYWTHAPYLGLGPSAHSFDGSRRWWNERSLRRYQAAVAAGTRPVAGSETLSARELALEALMLGLRTTEGVDLKAYRGRHGVDLQAANAGLLARLQADGLVRLSGGRLRPTLRGLAVADALARSFDLG